MHTLYIFEAITTIKMMNTAIPLLHPTNFLSPIQFFAPVIDLISSYFLPAP
jgi:hypothetical protein